MERLGFESAQLMTPVRDLSGGQKRRMQLLLILLDEPNVLIMDEPGNDLDADMLAVMEDLLDTWPGTLIVVSHDSYLLERVTDHQVALLGDGAVRDLPGGVEEYLRLRREAVAGRGAASGSSGSAAVEADAGTGGGEEGLSGAERRAVQKEVAAIERRLEKIGDQMAALQERMAVHDQSDYEGLRELSDTARVLQSESDSLEERWLELSDRLE